MLAQARSEGLVVEELGEETLVYDLERHQAHCLNRTAGLVWRQADGRTSEDAMASRLSEALGTPVDADLVRLALQRLDAARLLAAPATGRRVSRRELAGRLGLAALVPVVATLTAPSPAQAASCVADGDPCNGGTPCCSGLLCTEGKCPNP